MKQPRVPVNMEYCWYCQLLHAPLTHQLLLVSHLRCLSCRDALLTPPHSLLSLHSLHVGVSDSGGQVYQTLDARRPRISRGSCTRLEQPPASC